VSRYVKPGQAVAQLTIPASWVLTAAEVVRQLGLEPFDRIVGELQQDTNQARIARALVVLATGPDQKPAAIALALGCNLIALIDEWLAEAPDERLS